ncbi:hypothetical protein BCR42DRAFT_419844 [Absidia repens]|uniref:Small ribosomal subunit protein mS38 n=1 Tax=Absidia repens TaxID=90262 RepID=A0A1X2IAB8_9FUNG|nr:hypothetical protein BCR42DRAFT_419844 [Absidia repens]
MLFGRSIQRLVLTPAVLTSSTRTRLTTTTVRWASTHSSMSHSQPTSFPWTFSTAKTTVTDKVKDHLSTLRPFNAPPAPALRQPSTQSPLVEEGMQLTSTLRKRRLKMNKHKHKKLRKRTRALRKRLGK